MADERLLIDTIMFDERLNELHDSNSIELILRSTLNANWKINLRSYLGFQSKKRWPFIRLVERIKLLFECEKLQRRVLVKGKITINGKSIESFHDAKEFQNLFMEDENSYVIDFKVKDGIVYNMTRIAGVLEFYVNTENYFYFKFDGTFLPSITDFEENSLQIMNQLGKDMYALYQEKQFSDVSLHCGAEVFKVHKNVLSARSKVFSAMFQNPMKESEISVVEIVDMSSGTLQTLLEFIYSGRIENLSDAKACDLLAAAEKYDLKDLKRSCLLFLQSEMSVDNVLCILSFADIYDENLKKISVDFTCKEFDRLKNTQEWKAFQKEKAFLANEVLYNMIEFVNSHDRKNNI